MTNDTAIENLKKARKLIKKHGWVQGNFGDKDHGFCVIGAIRHVKYAADESLYCGLELDALEANVPGRALIKFNDADGRTQEEILTLYKLAIANLKAAA